MCWCISVRSGSEAKQTERERERLGDGVDFRSALQQESLLIWGHVLKSKHSRFLFIQGFLQAAIQAEVAMMHQAKNIQAPLHNEKEIYLSRQNTPLFKVYLDRLNSPTVMRKKDMIENISS